MPMPTDPMERMIRNALSLQHAGSSISAEGRRALAALSARLEAELRRYDVTGVMTRYRMGRMTALFEKFATVVREWLPEYDKVIRDGLVELGRAQAEFSRDSIVATIGMSAKRGTVVTPITQARLRAILNAEPFEGRVLRGHVKKIGANVVDQLMVQVRIGMTNEDALPAMVRRGRRVLGRSTRETEAVVRTAVTFITSKAHLGTFEANKAVVYAVRFSAALDDLTTEGCLALDGKVWPLGSPDIVEPGYHWDCRSVLVPEIDWKKLGLDPPPEGDRFARDLKGVAPEDLKRRVSARRRTGDLGKSVKVPGDLTAAQWLRQQPIAVQNRSLGVGKAALFRSGQVTLRDLIRRDHSVRPLAEVLARLK